MRTINWRHTDWGARNFVLSMGEQVMGSLSIGTSWIFKGSYTDHSTNLKFAQRSFWDRDMVITNGNEKVGEISSSILGRHRLLTSAGRAYFLSTSLFEQEAYWKTESGQTLITYQQATMSSLGKGTIKMAESLSVEEQTLLIASGIFARKAEHRRRVWVAVFMLFIASAARL